MKKLLLLFLIAILSGGMLFGQAVPDDWTGDNNIDTYREDVDPYQGDYAVKIEVHTANASQCDFDNTTEIPVTAGETFTVKFRYKTTNVAARAHFMWVGSTDNAWGLWSNANASSWTPYIHSGTVPAGATALKIGIRIKNQTGWSDPEIVHIDSVSFESPTGTPLTVNNGDLETWSSLEPNPEPGNYPTNFTDTTYTLLMRTHWVEDTIGPDFPDGYLVMGAEEGSTAPVPVDGTPVADDLDWNDGVVAMNRDFGINSYDFTDLEGLTEFTFTIYPYSNSGDDIDYKTDGTAPSASATTVDATMISSEDFESGTSGTWMAYDVNGDQEWIFPLFGGKYTAKMYGSSGGVNYANEDWLISPELDLSTYGDAQFAFMNVRNLDGELLKLFASTDYDGSGNPNDFTWDELTDMAAWSPGSYQWAYPEDIDLNDYLGESVYLAFKYTSTDAAAVLYKLDNMQVYSYNPYIDITDPNGGETLTKGTQYEITWNYDYLAEDDIAIYLSEGENNDMELITSATPVSTGSYTWTVWTSVESGEEYKIYIENPNGVSDFSDDYFSIIDADELIADFEADTTIVVVGDSVLFTDLTVGSPNSWLWTFEGGTPETYDGQQPPHIVYNDAGKWDVTLEVGDGTSTDSKTIEDYITSGFAPVADFEADVTEIVAGSYVNFTSLSTGDSLTFTWTFEGGTPETSSEENPMDIYYNIQADSTYDVTLTVTNMFGESTMVKEDYIHTTPTGINTFKNEKVSVYPNPANEYFILSSDQSGQVLVINASGRVVLTNTIEKGSNNIDVSSLGGGIYFVNGTFEDGSKFTTKIIVR